jgi:hypothetical protein
MYFPDLYSHAPIAEQYLQGEWTPTTFSDFIELATDIPCMHFTIEQQKAGGGYWWNGDFQPYADCRCPRCRLLRRLEELVKAE